MAAAQQLRIDCVNKADRPNAWERISHVGGPDWDGNRWKLTQQEAIQRIENGTYDFYVEGGGHRVRVIVSTSRFGNKYLKTEADDVEPNNLLSLPECP